MNKEHEVVLYQIDKTNICVSVFFREETFWMTQKAMAELFDCSTDNISLHLKNIFREEELDEKSTTEFFLVVQKLSAIYTIFCGLYGLRGLEIIFWIGRTGDFTRVIFYLICISP